MAALRAADARPSLKHRGRSRRDRCRAKKRNRPPRSEACQHPRDEKRCAVARFRPGQLGGAGDEHVEGSTVPLPAAAILGTWNTWRRNNSKAKRPICAATSPFPARYLRNANRQRAFTAKPPPAISHRSSRRSFNYHEAGLPLHSHPISTAWRYTRSRRTRESATAAWRARVKTRARLAVVRRARATLDQQERTRARR